MKKLCFESGRGFWVQMPQRTPQESGSANKGGGPGSVTNPHEAWGAGGMPGALGALVEKEEIMHEINGLSCRSCVFARSKHLFSAGRCFWAFGGNIRNHVEDMLVERW